MKKLSLGALLFASLLMVSGCGYNKLIGLDEDVKAAWSEVDNQYKRRTDLIPNLVSTVKGYANKEKDTLTAVVEARAKATQTTISTGNLSDPQAFAKFQQAQAGLSSALSRLMVGTFGGSIMWPWPICEIT